MASRVIDTMLICLIAVSSGCASDSIPAADAPVVFNDAGVDLNADLGESDGLPSLDLGDASAGDAVCIVGASSCMSKTEHQICKDLGGQPGWVQESCPAGTLCLDDKCSAECKDICNLDETRTVGGQTETCKLFSVAQDSFVPLSKGMHDRARQYNAWIRKHHLPEGTISDVYFSDATHKQVVAYHGTGDSAIWTGSYLAAEALRLKVTNAPDAKKNVEKLVEEIHELFQVTGHPGYHARYTAPVNHPDPKIKGLYNPNDDSHHVVKHNGQDYFWNGNTSRDQNSGVVMGYALAYDQLESEKHKQMIRDDMVGMCTELMKEHKGFPVMVRFYALGSWQELPLKIDMQYAVLNPSEYKNGAAWIQLGNDQDPSDYEHGTMAGFREYWPDYSTIIKQIPLLGALITFPIPRSGSMIMLGTIFRTCLMVTDGVPGYLTQHTAIKQHYDQNIQSWLGIMKQYIWLNAGPPRCWMKYYGLNIVYEPVYNLVRMEPDATLKASFAKDVLEAKMWPYAKDHKNVFFSYIYASQAPQGANVQAVISDASAQLAQFPLPPHAKVPVDNTGKAQYPAHSQCPGISTVAIDVADRVASDFIWQRNPFTLATTGDPKKVYPGVDYLLPYWMGRHHGFLQDDGAGTCLRWGP